MTWTTPTWERNATLIADAFANGVKIDPENPVLAECGMRCNDPAAFVAFPRASDGTEAAQRNHLAAIDADDAGTIIEFGGGYGSMALVTRSFEPRPLHVVVDLPAMLGVQERFLRQHGRNAGVIYVPADPADIDVLLPGQLLRGPVVFVASFSLDECTRECQDWWIGRDWFGADRVLVAARTGSDDRFPDGPGLVERLRGLGFVSVPCPFEGSVYLRWDRP